ncbi:MAG: TrkA C-terminal domain-containing protein [Oscillospiraceae bacterium]|nr:TrkA C-terminal domain-containing protein [Oscillospiraceae bacterium]
MNIYVAATLFAVLILLYWVISEGFTVLFRLIGLPAEKARFQVTSLLTGCGFTTRESEMILTTRVRRRLARLTMLFGYVFNITFLTALINVFMSLNVTQLKSRFFGMIIPVAAVIGVLYLSHWDRVRSWIDRRIDRLAGRLEREPEQNSILLVDQFGGRTIARVTMNSMPSELEGRPLAETGLRAAGILLLAVERKDLSLEEPSGDTILRQGDRLTVYGKFDDICGTFQAKERFTDDEI